MFTSRPRISLAVALFGAALMAAAVPAANAAESRSVTVEFADLDLSTEAGRTILQRRVDHAAAQACAPADTPAVRMMKAHQKCVEAAQANATRQFEAVVAQYGNKQFASRPAGN